MVIIADAVFGHSSVHIKEILWIECHIVCFITQESICHTYEHAEDPQVLVCYYLRLSTIMHYQDIVNLYNFLVHQR